MGKWLMGALLAATAWTPMAQAQDGNWHGRHGDGQQRPAGERPQGGEQGRGGWGGNRGERPQAQPQPQVAARAQADAGQRRDWRGNANGGAAVNAQAQGGWQGRRDWQRPQPQQRADAAPQQSWQGRDRNGDGRPDGYGRDRNGDGRPNGDGRYNGPRPGEQAYGRNGYDARDNGRRFDNGNRFDNRQGFNDGRRFDNGGRWSSGWRRDDRYDWNRYRSYNRNAFRLPRYYAPYGWNYGYRRFSIGVVLTSGLWGQDYWIDDPYAYRLPEAYGPYRWVRYYNDALLVDLRSGIVVDTVYDIFWY